MTRLGPSAVQTTPVTALRAWWTVGLLCVAAILSYTDRHVISVLIDPIRTDLAISDTQISLLQGMAFALFYTTMSIPLGRAADVVSRRMLISIGMIGWSLAAIGCGLAQTYGYFFLARILVGIGEAALMPAGMSLIGDLFPANRRAMASGVFAMGMVMGSGVATFAGGHLFDLAARGGLQDVPVLSTMSPWRAVLILTALPGLALAAIIWTSHEPVRHADAQTPDAPSLKQALGLLWRQRRQLIPLYLAMSIMIVGLYAQLGWMPSLLTREFHLTRSAVGSTLGLCAIVAGIAGSLGGGWISDQLVARYGRAARFRVILAGCAICIAGALSGLASSPQYALLLAGLWIFACTMSGTLGNTLVIDIVPARTRGVAIAIATVLNTILGMGIGPTLVALSNETWFGGANVGAAMVVVILPATLIATTLYAFAYRAVAKG